MSICLHNNLLQKKACFHYVDMLFPMETPWGTNSRLLMPPAGHYRFCNSAENEKHQRGSYGTNNLEGLHAKITCNNINTTEVNVKDDLK